MRLSEDDYQAVLAHCTERQLGGSVLGVVLAPRLLPHLTGQLTFDNSSSSGFQLVETPDGAHLMTNGFVGPIPPFDVVKLGSVVTDARVAMSLRLDRWFGCDIEVVFGPDRPSTVIVAPSNDQTSALAARATFSFDQYLLARSGRISWRSALEPGGALDGGVPWLLHLASLMFTPPSLTEAEASTLSEITRVVGRALEVRGTDPPWGQDNLLDDPAPELLDEARAMLVHLGAGITRVVVELWSGVGGAPARFPCRDLAAASYQIDAVADWTRRFTICELTLDRTLTVLAASDSPRIFRDAGYG